MVRWVFRPYTQIRRTICTSVSRRTSTRVSPGFVLSMHSSPSFGSCHACSHSHPTREGGGEEGRGGEDGGIFSGVLPVCISPSLSASLSLSLSLSRSLGRAQPVRSMLQFFFSIWHDFIFTFIDAFFFSLITLAEKKKKVYITLTLARMSDSLVRVTRRDV